jgi:hypothetical protein
MATWNAAQVEGVDNFDFEGMLAEDIYCAEWDELYIALDDEDEVVEE